jgi:hypothetical protein
MEQTKKTYHDLIIELIELRATDYAKFMDKLYEALAGEFKYVIEDGTPEKEKQNAIWLMISYFEKREEYEKCANLKKISESLKDKVHAEQVV